jgi:hypothetical protein
MTIVGSGAPTQVLGFWSYPSCVSLWASLCSLLLAVLMISKLSRCLLFPAGLSVVLFLHAFLFFVAFFAFALSFRCRGLSRLGGGSSLVSKGDFERLGGRSRKAFARDVGRV